jgi:hypothetical protein
MLEAEHKEEKNFTAITTTSMGGYFGIVRLNWR